MLGTVGWYRVAGRGTLGPGSYRGGIRIDKSIDLVGAGTSKTTIKGGGPVITIGRFMGADPPRVQISKLVITGGRTRGNGVEALGGGIYVPPAKGFRPGATVVLEGVAVVENRVAPTRTRGPAPGQEKEWPACPGGPCPAAIASGGGIETWGSLTVRSSEIDRNVVAGPASDAVGGGIASNLGSLRIVDCEIARNRAAATAPKARFAEGGGVFVGSGSVTIRGSNLEGNSAILRSKLPAMAGKKPIEMNANSGGLHLSDGVPATISSTTISESKVEVDDPRGEPVAFAAGMLMGDAPLRMSKVRIVGSHLIAAVADSTVAGLSGGALEIDGGGTVEGLRLISNSSQVSSAEGSAQGGGALQIVNFNHDAKPTLIRDSTIRGNRLAVTSQRGSALARGAGVLNDSLLTLDDVEVSANRAHATAPEGEAQGGGIWNGSEVTGPPVSLSIKGSTVAANSAVGSGGASARGGGIFSNSKLSLSGTALEGNLPDATAPAS